MKFMSILLSILFLLMVLVSSVAAKTISFSEFILQLEQLPQAKVLELNKKLLEVGAEKPYSVKDVSINAQLGYNRGKDSSFPTTEVVGLKTLFKVSKLILPSGSQISLGLDFQTLTPTNTDTTSYKPQISLGLTQPLLKNWLGVLNRYPIKDAEYNEKIETLKIYSQKQELKQYYSALFYQYLYTKNMIDLMQIGLNNSTALANQTRKKKQNSLVDEDHYQSTVYQALVYRENVLQLNNTLLQISNQLLELTIDMPADEEWAKVQKKLKTKTIQLLSFDETLIYSSLILARKRTELSVIAFKQQMMPELNLVGQLSMYNLDSEFGDSWDISQSINAYFGVQMIWIPANTKAKLDLKETELKLRVMEQDIIKNQKNYQKQLDNLKLQFLLSQQKIGINKEQIKSIIKRQKSEKKKYAQGRFSLNDMILTDNLLMNEKIDTLNLQMKLIESSLSYQTLTLQVKE